MGLSLSLLPSAWQEIVTHWFFCLARDIDLTYKRQEMTLRTNSFKQTDSETGFDMKSSKNSINLKNCEPMKVMLETTLSFKNLVQDIRNSGLNKEVDGSIDKSVPSISLPEPAILFSPRPVSELDAAAVTLQKVYKSYRTRRNLADCAVVVEELWWKALDFAALRQSSVSFFSVEKHETAGSRWARARTRAAKVGKGLSKDEKAQKLALQHWLEAIDPRHRYGHNLHLYYDIWFDSKISQPFFYWLDVGNGKEVNLKSCPRVQLQCQCMKYLGPKEREAYEVIVENGKLVYKQTGLFIETPEGSKWIFVLSTSRTLYVGQKKKGVFQHSSFLSGGATTAAGRLVAHAGVLEAIRPYNGYYLTTKDNFQKFISFLKEHNVDLTNVKRYAIDDDYPSFRDSSEEPKPDPVTSLAPNTQSEEDTTNSSYVDVAVKEASITTDHQEDMEPVDANVQSPFDLAKRLSCKWSAGAGPRIGCVRDYPVEPSALTGGGKIVGPIALSSSEFASTNNKAQRVRQDKSGSAASNSKKKRTREQEECEEINTSITLDDLRQHYGRKRKDVAESLGVSVSTLKRTCRQYGIKRWPNIIRKKAGRHPDQHGENNPSPTCKTLSTKGQTEMENEIVEGANEAWVSSECEFQLKNQWLRFSAYPNSGGPVVPNPHMASTQILGENMESLGDLRNLFASLEEPLLQLHVSGSMWTVPPCLDQAPSRLMPTIAHTMGSSDDLRNLLPLVEEPFSVGHVSGSIDWTIPPCSVPAPSQPMPTIAHTTGSSDDLRNLLPMVEEPFSAGHVSGSFDWTVPPCSVPAPSQPMPTIAHTTGISDDLRNLPMVEEPFSVGHVSRSIDWTVPLCSVPAPSQPIPTIAHTTGSSDDLRNLLALMEEPFSAGQVSGSFSWTGPSCFDPALSQLMPTIPHPMPTIPRMMPLLTERQDTRSVKLRATYGDTTIKFNLPPTSGISELNKEVLKRLEFEPGKFRVEYEDEDGLLILIACDEDVRDYLQFLTTSGNQVFKPLVLKKVPKRKRQ